MKKYNKILFVIIVGVMVIHMNSIKVFGKPISNVFQATIDVVSNGTTVGDGEEHDYDDINKAIKDAKENSEIKIKGGKYNINSIIDKDVTLKSLDDKYVDIITKGEIPNNIKIKVGSKVTINQEGVSPIKIEIKQTNRENKKVLTGNNIKINAKQGEDIKIWVNQEIINKLGFHSYNLKVKFLKNDGVIVGKNNEKIKIEGVKSKEGIYYSFGEFSRTRFIIVNLKFTKSGEYPIEIFVDDGR